MQIFDGGMDTATKQKNGYLYKLPHLEMLDNICNKIVKPDTDFACRFPDKHGG
jgi:hypothetical protein